MFAQKIGAQRIGIANCVGCRKEARLFAKVLKAKGFDSVFGIGCKLGALDKTKAGIPEGTKVAPGGHESMCNPVAQARLLAQQKTDLNVIIGLCVGHDSIFIKHSEAPVTYLMVKDRVTCHNPAAPLHQMETFYKRLLQPGYPDPLKKEHV